MADPAPAPDTLARVIAIYGAATATVSLAHTLLRDWRDRGQLKIRAMVAEEYEIVQGAMLSTRRRPFLVFTASNIGRRPIRVHHITASFGRNDMKADCIPHEDPPPWDLTEGGSKRFKVPLELFDRDPLPTSICVVDSVEREWRLGSRQFRKLRDHAIKTIREEKERRGAAKGAK